ncbi:hypothetical protein GUJ93_ZPchr0013g36187 [Zizania palustris]|uniref:Uncharacterized protein n=1 Tax=Zizania palustris TaxID=103762 RepID=A0A8J5WS39_ZIZPA|nr:hypothetical protein GUJ93_ZPchr0013g36187 [Zizania palustris]
MASGPGATTSVGGLSYAQKWKEDVKESMGVPLRWFEVDGVQPVTRQGMLRAEVCFESDWNKMTSNGKPTSRSLSAAKPVYDEPRQ